MFHFSVSVSRGIRTRRNVVQVTRHVQWRLLFRPDIAAIRWQRNVVNVCTRWIAPKYVMRSYLVDIDAQSFVIALLTHCTRKWVDFNLSIYLTMLIRIIFNRSEEVFLYHWNKSKSIDFFNIRINIASLVFHFYISCLTSFW